MIAWGKSSQRGALPATLHGLVNGKIRFKISAYSEGPKQLRYRLVDADGKLLAEDFRGQQGAKDKAQELVT